MNCYMHVSTCYRCTEKRTMSVLRRQHQVKLQKKCHAALQISVEARDKLLMLSAQLSGTIRATLCARQAHDDIALLQMSSHISARAPLLLAIWHMYAGPAYISALAALQALMTLLWPSLGLREALESLTMPFVDALPCWVTCPCSMLP